NPRTSVGPALLSRGAAPLRPTSATPKPHARRRHFLDCGGLGAAFAACANALILSDLCRVTLSRENFAGTGAAPLRPISATPKPHATRRIFWSAAVLPPLSHHAPALSDLCRF